VGYQVGNDGSYSLNFKPKKDYDKHEDYKEDIERARWHTRDAAILLYVVIALKKNKENYERLDTLTIAHDKIREALEILEKEENVFYEIKKV
jgi:hypothetical protein